MLDNSLQTTRRLDPHVLDTRAVLILAVLNERATRFVEENGICSDMSDLSRYACFTFSRFWTPHLLKCETPTKIEVLIAPKRLN